MQEEEDGDIGEKTMNDEINQWREELKRDRDELKLHHEETDRVIRESREMDASLKEAWSRLEAQTKELINSQEELKECIRELEAAIPAEGVARMKGGR